MAKIDFPSPATQGDTYTQNSLSWVYNGEAWDPTPADASSIDDTAYGISWDGSVATAPSQNAVYDKIETIGGSAADDTAYGVSWNGDTTTAPSKNAVYDKIETIGGGSTPSDTVYGAGWNGDTTNSASKNAIYDKIETLIPNTEFDAAGDLLLGTGSNALNRLPIGTTDQVLTVSGSTAVWATASGDVATDDVWDAVGDIAVGTGANTAAVIPIGVNGQVLKSDGTTAVWGTVAGTGDVVGVASSTLNAVSLFSDTTGKAIKNSTVTIDGSGNITTAGTVDGRDVSADGSTLDGLLTADATNVTAALDAASLTDEGTPAATDQILIKDAATGVLQTADFSEFGGGGSGGTVQGTAGTLALQPTDDGAAAGNARAANSVDWQTSRSAATMVAGGTYSVLAGGRNNKTANTNTTVGGGSGNSALGSNSTVAGGALNVANQTGGFVGGGQSNTAALLYTTTGGGKDNTNGSNYGFIGGGLRNEVSGNVSVIAGGSDNEITGTYNGILGGQGNIIYAAHAAIIGGHLNSCLSNYSVTSGRRAKTGTLGANLGVFVYADSTDADYTASSANTANFRVANGMHITAPLFIDERAAALADIAGRGQIWVKTKTAANELFFTDDTGEDMPLSSPVGTVAQLPVTPVQGQRAFVTDSQNSLASHHGQTVNGGAAIFVPVYYDGAAWLVG